MSFPAKVFLIVAVAAPLLTAKTFYEERDTAPVTTGSVANLKADNVQGAPVAPDGPTKLSGTANITRFNHFLSKDKNYHRQGGGGETQA
jgi:hypothetical protein